MLVICLGMSEVSPFCRDRLHETDPMRRANSGHLTTTPLSTSSILIVIGNVAGNEYGAGFGGSYQARFLETARLLPMREGQLVDLRVFHSVTGA